MVTTILQSTRASSCGVWADRGKIATEIAELLQRDVTTVRRRMRRSRVASLGGRAGRPRALTPKEEKKVVCVAEQMIQQADGEWQITADMVKAALKLKRSTGSRPMAHHGWRWKQHFATPPVRRAGFSSVSEAGALPKVAFLPHQAPWTVVDRNLESRGPLFFHTRTVVDLRF